MSHARFGQVKEILGEFGNNPFGIKLWWQASRLRKPDGGDTPASTRAGIACLSE
jgi:hypothetical protein